MRDDLPGLSTCGVTADALGVTGSAAVGSALTATVGTFRSTAASAAVHRGVPELTWQWLRNGTPIGRATAPTYLLTPADAGATITVRAVVVQPGYRGTVVSRSVSVPGVASPGLPARTLTVAASARPVHRGATATFTVTGLAAREAWTLTVSGRRLASGRADAAGRASAAVVVPRSWKTRAARAVVVTGATAQRTGRATLTTTAPATLGVKVASTSLVRGRKQKVTVTGLVAGEKVTVRVVARGGKKVVVSTGYATAAGRRVVTFAHTGKAGTVKVRATGGSRERTGRSTYRVR